MAKIDERSRARNHGIHPQTKPYKAQQALATDRSHDEMPQNGGEIRFAPS